MRSSRTAPTARRWPRLRSRNGSTSPWTRSFSLGMLWLPREVAPRANAESAIRAPQRFAADTRTFNPTPPDRGVNDKVPYAVRSALTPLLPHAYRAPGFGSIFSN